MTNCDLRQVDVSRRSSRTGQTHSLGGFVGSLFMKAISPNSCHFSKPLIGPASDVRPSGAKVKSAHARMSAMAHPIYSEKFLDHFQNPRNVGELEPPAITVEVMNPVCGDILRLSALFENDAVAEVAYKARGCTASLAAGVSA